MSCTFAIGVGLLLFVSLAMTLLHGLTWLRALGAGRSTDADARRFRWEGDYSHRLDEDPRLRRVLAQQEATDRHDRPVPDSPYDPRFGFYVWAAVLILSATYLTTSSACT